VIAVTFTFAPEYDQTLTVQPDGFAAVKDVGELYIEGMALPELRAVLHAAYAKTLHDPQVTVELKDFDKPSFIVNGAIGHPGKYELRGETSVNVGLALAGGFTSKSKHSQVVLFRRLNSDLVEARVLNVKKMLQARDLSEDVYLRPGDLLYVPQNTISKIERYLPVSSVGMYLNSLQF
jgi:polysaccharide export outer membrane protein